MITKSMLDASKHLRDAKIALEGVDMDLPYEDGQLNGMIERAEDLEQEFDTWMINKEEE